MSGPLPIRSLSIDHILAMISVGLIATLHLVAGQALGGASKFHHWPDGDRQERLLSPEDPNSVVEAGISASVIALGVSGRRAG